VFALRPKKTEKRRHEEDSFQLINILDYDLLFITILHHCHWALGIANLNQKKISFWDGKEITSPAFFKNISLQSILAGEGIPVIFNRLTCIVCEDI